MAICSKQAGQTMGRAKEQLPSQGAHDLPCDFLWVAASRGGHLPREGHKPSKNQEAALSAARPGRQLVGPGLKASSADSSPLLHQGREEGVLSLRCVHLCQTGEGFTS